MKKESIKNMTGGWFIGNFSPTLNQTEDVEVAVKRYKKGDKEASHHHKVATEYTVIISGKVRMKDIFLEADDVLIIEPGDSTDFEALEDTVTVVVKTPSVKGDKYVD